MLFILITYLYIKIKNKITNMTFDKLNLKPEKYDWDTNWTVTCDLRCLETFEKYDNNYEIVDKLKEQKILSEKTDEDSEYCQFFAYFKTKKSAESFINRLGKYVDSRKKLIESL